MENESYFDWRGFMRAHRGGLEPIILDLLKEKPMHGYEIMRTLEERSHGIWRPSAGSVYPILQLLEDKDLVEVSDKGGKKIYTITELGRSHQTDSESTMPWKNKHSHILVKQIKEIMPSVKIMKHAIKEIMISGSAEQQEEVGKIIKDTATAVEKIAKGIKSK